MQTRGQAWLDGAARPSHQCPQALLSPRGWGSWGVSVLLCPEPSTALSPCPPACLCAVPPGPPVPIPHSTPQSRAEQTVSGVSTCWGHCQGDTRGTQMTSGHRGRTINNLPPRFCWG